MQTTQYVGKNNTPFNIRLNNHRKDVKDPKTILADKHFHNTILCSIDQTGSLP